MMKRDLTQIERLDLAARAEAVEPFLLRAKLPLGFLTVVGLLLGLGSQGSSYETLFLSTLILLALGTTFMLWRRWCYASYGLVILNLLAAINKLVSLHRGDSGFLIVSAEDQFFLVWFAANGLAWWRVSGPFIAAHAADFDKERGEVGQWLADLKQHKQDSRVLEFSAKSFWSGSGTYRPLNLGKYWAVAKFKSDDLRNLTEYRILSADSIAVVESIKGSIRVDIASHYLGDIRIAPEMRTRLLSTLAASVKD